MFSSAYKRRLVGELDLFCPEPYQKLQKNSFYAKQPTVIRRFTARRHAVISKRVQIGMTDITMAVFHLTTWLFIFSWVQADLVHADECTQGFSVVTPEVAAPGRTTAVLVTLHGPEASQATNVTLRLVSDRVEELTQLLAEVSQEIRGHGIVPIAVPAEATGNCILQTLVNCSSADDCSLQSSSELQLVGSVRDIIIRPARKSYRPGETVSFWVLALDHDLRVATDMIGSVFVRNPAGTKVALWEEVALDEGKK